MSEVIVDTEKLAYGLERGIGRTRTIFAAGPVAQRLRFSPCGLVSSAIDQYALKNDIPTQLMIISPNLAFDSEMQHVLPFLGDEKQERVVADASFSQFLGYVGLHWGYEKAAKEVAFPAEKIIDYKISETDVVVDWLTDVAVSFQKRNRRPKTRYGTDLGGGPLVIARPKDIKSAFAKIYDPQNYVKWTPPEEVIRHGQIVSSYIPEGSIAYV